MLGKAFQAGSKFGLGSLHSRGKADMVEKRRAENEEKRKKDFKRQIALQQAKVDAAANGQLAR